MASFAIRPSITGYADRSAKTDHELTSTPDHLMGADHRFHEFGGLLPNISEAAGKWGSI